MAASRQTTDRSARTVEEADARSQPGERCEVGPRRAGRAGRQARWSAGWASSASPAGWASRLACRSRSGAAALRDAPVICRSHVLRLWKFRLPISFPQRCSRRRMCLVWLAYTFMRTDYQVRPEGNVSNKSKMRPLIVHCPLSALSSWVSTVLDEQLRTT